MTNNFAPPHSDFIGVPSWRIVDGRWDLVGFERAEAREFLLDRISHLRGNLLNIAQRSRSQLQQFSMAAGRNSFEEIQQEAPFSRYAQSNMDMLLRAWKEEAETGFARVWDQIFRSGWEAARVPQNPIQIIGSTGDSEERALEVNGAVNQKTRVAAEWWYLYYTFGHDWTPGMHATIKGNEDGVSFSVHDIHIHPDTSRQVYFRLPW
jgi:hypothetical protein